MIASPSTSYKITKQTIIILHKNNEASQSEIRFNSVKYSKLCYTELSTLQTVAASVLPFIVELFWISEVWAMSLTK